jgi:flavin-binding protein dodecin
VEKALFYFFKLKVDSRIAFMKKNILLVGDWHSNIHEQPFSEGLAKAGLVVTSFKWFLYFQQFSEKGRIADMFSRLQNKYMLGFLVKRLNRDLVEQVNRDKPDILFVYRGSHIYPKTLQYIRDANPDILIIGYNNDDPFSALYPKWKWRHFNHSIPYYDLLLAYRFSNLSQFMQRGAKKVDMLRSWFLPAIHKKMAPEAITNKSYSCDVIFIGHYEPDGRMEMLDALAAKQISVKIFGPSGPTSKTGWDEAIANSIHLSTLSVSYLRGNEYVQAINSAKIALCFLSKLNNDTYTRRCFEIPACGTALFSEWSEDLSNLFEDGVNAVLFKSEKELVDRVKYYLSHPVQLQELADKGRELVQSKGHDVYSRASWLVNKYSLLTAPGKINHKYN